MSKALEVWKQDLKVRSKKTKSAYTRNFNRFLERWELTAEELYEMRKADLDSDDPRDHQNVERKVRVQMAEMHGEGYAASSCKMLGQAVVSFFESQGLPLKLKAKDKPKGYANGQSLALKEHIKRMWDYAPTETKLRTRALLMFLKDSGIRISDAANLDVGDYLEARDVEVNGEKFKVFRALETEKTAAPAYVHIGSEAVTALDAYLEERGTEAGPLFPNRFGKRPSADSIGQSFRRLADLLEIKNVSAHSLRKYHTTMLQSAGVHDSWIKLLEGKKVGGSMGPYTRPEEAGELTKAYVEAYPKLRVFGEQVSSQAIEEQTKEIERLNRVNQELRQQIREAEQRQSALESENTERDGKISKLEEDLAEIRRLLKARA